MNENFNKNTARWNNFEALLKAHKNLLKKHIELVDQLDKFRDNLPTNPVTSKEDRIIEMVMDEFESDPRQETRKMEVVIARQAATFLIKQTTPLSYKQISNALSCSDHTTSLHNYHKAIERMHEDVDFCWRVNNVAKELGIKNLVLPERKTNFNEKIIQL